MNRSVSFLGETKVDSDQVVSEIVLSKNETIIASMKFGDSVRKSVKNLISNLRTQNLTLHLISGDSSKSTQTGALAAGIDLESAFGGLLPHEKAGFIKDLRRSKEKVAMVGDGINDAAAMAESDLAVAVRSGLNPREGVAAITLMQEDPAQLLDFIRLAKKVNRTVKQNLIFALIYNLIGIPIAASGMLSPIIAAIAMLFSSLSVTFNTLLLVKKEVVLPVLRDS